MKPCPDHGAEATMLGMFGDSYCLAPGCDWWYMPLEGEDEAN